MHTVEQAAAALNLSKDSIVLLLKTHDETTGTTRLERWQPDEGPPIRDIRITTESLQREMKRRGLA